MNLHKLLKIEEGLRYRELIAASRRGQEVLELGPIRQLQYDVVNLAQGLRVHILQVLPLQYRIEEKFADLTHIGVLQGHL